MKQQCAIIFVLAAHALSFAGQNAPAFLDAAEQTRSIKARMHALKMKLASVSREEIIATGVAPEALESEVARIPEMNQQLLESMRAVEYTSAYESLRYLRLNQREVDILAAYKECVS